MPMCGITGFVDHRNNSNGATLKRMADTLAHRGPDGEGCKFFQLSNCQVGLGHRRLSIIDLTDHASQPMSYDGLHIVFNGEIYNYRQIRYELEKLGHQFTTSSDTEVILHAWRQWGFKAIDQWHGMFAIALFDEKNNKFFFIRDRVGIKPLYYYKADGLVIFGSELKSILKHPGFKKEIDPSAVATFLQYGYVSWPHCIYKNTFKVSPGHLLEIDLENDLFRETRYWNVYDCYNKPKTTMGFADAAVETEAVLKKAFNYRMVADVPVGVFLSGGYDSTCVTALLQQESTEKIKTFTIGMADDKLDEAPYAKQIAKHLGTDHTEHYCTAAEALALIPQLPIYYDEPFADSSAIPTMLVSKVARRSVTVALSADAGDEIFAGYNRYDYITRYGSKLNAIPAPLRKIAYSLMDNISSDSIPILKDQYNFHGRYTKLKNLLKNPSPQELLKNLSQTFTNDELTALFANDVTELRTAHHIQKEPYLDDISYMMAVDYQTYLTDDILQKVDRATMAASLEGREPFLDQDIIAWAAQLPTAYKYNNGQKKYILKEIVHKYVPKHFMERPKMGFGLPIEKWLSKELKDLVRSVLNRQSLQKHNLFNADVVLGIVDKFYAGRTEKHLQVWYLFMFQLWFENWI